MNKILSFSAAIIFLVFTASFSGETEFTAELETDTVTAGRLAGRLEIFRLAGDPGMTPAFFRRLYERTPAAIQAVLREYGYFSPEISPELITGEKIHAARFRVSPGPSVRVSAVRLSYRGEYLRCPYGCVPSPEEIEKEWLLPEGARFSRERWDTAKRRLLRKFLVNCYPAAEIIFSEAFIDPETAEARLSVEIDSGPAFTLGELRIEGLEIFPEQLVHNLNFIRKGTPHSREKLLGLRNRLMETGYFEFVDVRIEPDPAEHAAAPILVSVEENKRKEITFGLEISSDTGAGARFEYSDLNLRRRGLKLRNVLQGNMVERLFLSDLQTPARPDGAFDNYNFTAAASDIRQEEVNLLRFGFSRTRPMGTFLRAARLQYSRETRRTPDGERLSVRSLSPVISWSARETDHLLYPTRGYLLKIRTAGALDGVFSDAGFAHLNARTKIFLPAGDKNLFIARAESGHVIAGSRERIPSEFLFRTGGADSIRGYGYRSIGVEERGAVVGGRYLATGSIEYERAVGDRWSAALFVDGGGAHDDWSEFEAFLGYGAGIRIKIPAGPVNLDLAYGEKRNEYRLHFTMGVIF